jgi:hypothetical protein
MKTKEQVKAHFDWLISVLEKAKPIFVDFYTKQNNELEELPSYFSFQYAEGEKFIDERDGLECEEESVLYFGVYTPIEMHCCNFTTNQIEFDESEYD